MNASALNSMEVKAKPARGGKRSRASGGMVTATGAVLADKKESEKERRKRMKTLCEKLASLIPREHFDCTDTMTQLGSLDVAASYIKKLQGRIDELQHRRSSVQAMDTLKGATGIPTPTTTTTTSSGAGSLKEDKSWEASAPVLEVRQHDDSNMEVRMICGTERLIRLHDMITVLVEEGAEIVNANHSVAGHKFFYTIHSRALSSRIGIDVSRVSQRLGALALPRMRSDRVLTYPDRTNVTPPKQLVSNNGIGETKKVSNPECDFLVEPDQVMWSSLLASISSELLEQVSAM